jgi:hypothetical protein
MSALILVLAGCGRPTAEPAAAPPPPAPPAKGVVQQSIEGFTGKTAVDNYKRTEEKIKTIGAGRKENFKDSELAP